MGRLIVFGSLVSVAFILQWILGAMQRDARLGPFPVLSVTFLGLSLPFFLVAWSILPRRKTNAFYLRSFRTDRQTWPIRQAIRSGLGRKYRLSGIRDPRRRRSPLDYGGYAIFLLRYSTTKFMNLEASGDWKSRLCGSLADARCVFIDVTQMTPFVAAEIERAVNCVGLSRIQFVVDPSRDERAWRELIAAHLPPSTPRETIQVVTWNGSSRASRREFQMVVRAFACRLPAGSAGLSDEALKFAERQPDPVRPEYVHNVQFALSNVFVPVGAAGFGTLLGFALPPLEHLWQTIFGCVVAAVVAWFFVDYLVNCTPAQRLVAGCLMSCVVAWYSGLCWLFIVDPAREVSEDIRVAANTNRLQEIGVAISHYYSTANRLPPDPNSDAFTDDSRPRDHQDDTSASLRHSWQTALLPFLEHNGLYQTIALKKRWDAPENEKVFKRPVAEYLDAGVRRLTDDNGRALSHFAGNSRVFGNARGLTYNDFENGTGNTFIAGEAEDHFRPWGDPQNHREPGNGVKRGPDSFGCPGMSGTIVLMADGSVRTISVDVDPELFQALGTPHSRSPLSGDYVAPMSVRHSLLSDLRRELNQRPDRPLENKLALPEPPASELPEPPAMKLAQPSAMKPAGRPALKTSDPPALKLAASTSAKALGLTGHAASGADGAGGAKKYRIAVVAGPGGPSDEYWKSVHAGAAKAANELGDFEILWKESRPESDRDGQIAVMKAVIASRVDGICLAPSDPQALIESVNQSAKERIPVVIFDSGLADESKIATCVVTDYYQSGTLAARRMGEVLHGAGNVILLRYVPGIESLEQRGEGFLDTLRKEFPKIKILSSDKYAGPTPQESLSRATDVLMRFRQDVNGIVAVTEPNAMGTLEALEGAGLVGKIALIAFGSNDELIGGLKSKRVQGLVVPDPVKIGYETVLALHKHLKGEKLPKRINLGESVLTPENLSEPSIQQLLKPQQLQN